MTHCPCLDDLVGRFDGIIGLAQMVQDYAHRNDLVYREIHNLLYIDIYAVWTLTSQPNDDIFFIQKKEEFRRSRTPFIAVRITNYGVDLRKYRECGTFANKSFMHHLAIDVFDGLVTTRGTWKMPIGKFFAFMDGRRKSYLSFWIESYRDQLAEGFDGFKNNPALGQLFEAILRWADGKIRAFYVEQKIWNMCHAE